MCLLEPTQFSNTGMQRKPDTHVGYQIQFEDRLSYPLCTVQSHGGWGIATNKATCTIGRIGGFMQKSQIVYIRGVNGEDMSTFIKSVTFTLHASFRQNQRGE